METHVQTRKGMSSGGDVPAADLLLERYTYAAWASGPGFHWPPVNRPASTPTARARYSYKTPFTFGTPLRCDFEAKGRACGPNCSGTSLQKPTQGRVEAYCSLSVCAPNFSALSPPWSSLLLSSYLRSFQMKIARPRRSWRCLAEGLKR